MVEQLRADRGARGRRPHATGAGLDAVLRAAVTRMCEVSGADIVALYPYDEETDSFYAPVAVGLPEADVVRALPDLAEQIQRFRTDEAQGKVQPSDEKPETRGDQRENTSHSSLLSTRSSLGFTPAHYGPHAWLLATRQPLISTDAMHEVESTFVRRHRVSALVGLPLLIGSRVVGLLFLDYVDRPGGHRRPDVTAPEFVERMQHHTAEMAATIDVARQAEESGILRAVSDLVGGLAAVPSATEDPQATVRQMEGALHRVLAAAQLDAAALYVPDSTNTQQELLASQGIPGLAAEAPAIWTRLPDAVCRDDTLVAALARHDLHPLVSLASRGQGHRGVMVLADRDPLALQRRLPAERMLLQTAADLLGAMLNAERLLDALGESNRTLGAVTRLGMRLLSPGATQEEALTTAVMALTDPALPELNFEFANIFLLEADPTGEGRLAVREAAGSTMSGNVPSVLRPGPSGTSGRTHRVPTWAAPGYRVVDTQDILSYVATRRRVVIVGAHDTTEDDHFVTGYPEEMLVRKQVPILHADGSVATYVRAARLREAADRGPLRGDDEEGAAYRVTDDFTLNAELYDAYGHSSLIRVFVPFGSDRSSAVSGDGAHPEERATGVLEAGFHISRTRRLQRVEVEALRACAATIAVAVQTARLYEDLNRRARQLEITNDVSRAIATSIDLEQTLSLIARNMARAVETSVCLIALLDEDGSAWYGAAASDLEDVWRQRRVERPTPSIIFEVADKGAPMVVEDAQNHELVSGAVARLYGIRSLVALPLSAGDSVIGAVVLGQRDQNRLFTTEEVERASGLAGQAAMAIRNARVHAREEEEHHIQKDVILVGFGQWGQKAYKHLVLLKNFFNFRTHVVEVEWPGQREKLALAEAEVLANGDLFYWDRPEAVAPAHDALLAELEPSCYVITYVATPAESHLPMIKAYYDLSNVILVEKPLGASPEEYRAFLDSTDGSVQIVAADHYWFKLEVRLLELLLTEERNLRAFLDEIEEVEIELVEEQSPAGGSGAQIGMIADLIPHAFAVLSLLTPLDRVQWADQRPLQIGRYQPLVSDHETYARLVGSFDYHGRRVRVSIDVGKGVTNAKWVKLSGQRHMGGRRPFYKFDLARGIAIDGTQSALRAATRPIRQPGVPDNAHLSMLRHVIDKKNPAVGILSIREAIRANARIQELVRMANDMLAAGDWVPYEQGRRPIFVGLSSAARVAAAHESLAQR